MEDYILLRVFSFLENRGMKMVARFGVFNKSRFWGLISLLFVFALSGMAHSDTIIGNNIIKDTTLTKDRSPYIVPQNIDVMANVTLKIEPGVTIKFDQGTNLDIFGTIIAYGTASEMIVFTSNMATPARLDWEGISFRTGSVGTIEDENGDYAGGSIFSYCEFNFARLAISNEIYNSNLHIMNSFFNNLGKGIYHLGTGRFENNSWNSPYLGELLFIHFKTNYSVVGTISIKNNQVTNGVIYAGGNDSASAIIQDNHIMGIGRKAISGNGNVISQEISGNIVENGYIEVRCPNTQVFNNTIKNSSFRGISIPSETENVSIYNNVITNHEQAGIYIVKGSSTIINDNIIANNGGDGILNFGTAAIISQNEITNNSGYGIFTTHIGTFTRNNIYGNKLYDFYYTSITSDQIATNNYWGTTNSSEISNNIFDSFEDITGEVIFEPYATKPFTIQAPNALTPIPIPLLGN